MDGLVATPLIHNSDKDNTLTLAQQIRIPAHTEAKIPVISVSIINHNSV